MIRAVGQLDWVLSRVDSEIVDAVAELRREIEESEGRVEVGSRGRRDVDGVVDLRHAWLIVCTFEVGD